MYKPKMTLPPVIVMDFFGKYKELQPRIAKVMKAQLGIKEFDVNQELLTQMAPLAKELDNVIIATENGNKTLIVSRNDLTEKLSYLMLYAAQNTTALAGTNLETLQKSGFKLKSEGKPKPPFSAPQNLRSLKSLPSGTIISRVNSVPGKGVFYLFDCAEIKPDGTTDKWVSFKCGYVTYTFTNLLPGTVYAIRVAAVDKQGTALYSPSIKVSSGMGE